MVEGILFVIIVLYFVISEWLEDRKKIASIPEIEYEIKVLIEKEKKLIDWKKQVSDNVISYREKYEDDKKRKIYFAKKRKRQIRKFY